ncbi:MAG: aspartate-semialdehyde dehydrogenase [Nitrospirota bacterium]
MKKKDKYVVCIAGATGVVGNEMITILEERNFPVDTLRLYASERSAGKVLSFKNKDITVELLTESAFDGVDIALFSAGTDTSRKYSPIAAQNGAVVIDNSNAFRMETDVPLIVPEVNPGALSIHKGIIANPNCSTIQMVVALKPLHDEARIKRIVVTTFQSVSGTGKEAMDELLEQTGDILNFKEIRCNVYPYQIAFNCIPHIDTFLENGYSREETKMVNETRKIMEDNAIRITATTVRVPVFRAHSLSINIETERKVSANEARAIFASSPGITVFDAPQKMIYPVPVDVSYRDEVYIGRVREDESIPNGLNLWVVADNLRKGAALNAIQIAEELIK